MATVQQDASMGNIARGRVDDNKSSRMTAPNGRDPAKHLILEQIKLIYFFKKICKWI
jgi:hypothetical protein